MDHACKNVNTFQAKKVIPSAHAVEAFYRTNVADMPIFFNLSSCLEVFGER